DFTGDMPILLGPDGPSLGGFVCPAVVVEAERWKLGQLKAGDKVRFKRLTVDEAAALAQEQNRLLREGEAPAEPTISSSNGLVGASPSERSIPPATSGNSLDEAILAHLDATADRPAVTY